MTKDESCYECSEACLSCDEFEQRVMTATDIEYLKVMRRTIANTPVQVHLSSSDKFACTLVSIVFTMTFFALCNGLAFIPVISAVIGIPEHVLDAILRATNFVSSNWLQLILLPLIGIDATIKSKKDDLRRERQYRIILITDRIDELKSDARYC